MIHFKMYQSKKNQREKVRVVDIQKVIHYQDQGTNQHLQSSEKDFLDKFEPAEDRYDLSLKDINHLADLMVDTSSQEEWEHKRDAYLSELYANQSKSRL